VKNGGSRKFDPLIAVYGGNVKKVAKLCVLGAAVVLGAGVWLSGCKSAPELTQANALALIQAKYDQSPAVPASVTVDDLGMREGLAAKYWERSKVYPNNYWGDFTLTTEGKKAIKLAGGGNVIQWRPENLTDKRFSVTVLTTAANHLKARDAKDVQDDAAGGKSIEFSESMSLDGVPDALQGIAHNPGNKLATKRTASFVLDNGAWKLNSIQ
jgi:hypothetical protein